MKIDELLKSSAKPVKDAGFTDRVMRSLDAERIPVRVSPVTAWLARLDLTAVETAGIAFAAVVIVAAFSKSPGGPETILNAVTRGTGFLVGGALVAVDWLFDGPLFEGLT